MNSSKVIDQRGMAKHLKTFLPRPVFRGLTKVYNGLFSTLPYGLKYAMATKMREGKVPYSLIEDGDVVVQIGCPRDLLEAGRSRTIHFARLVGRGKVIVIEPDPDNCKAIEAFVARNGLQNQIALVPLGAWESETTLTFLSSEEHPASNLLEAVTDVPGVKDTSKYTKIEVPVDSVDHILDKQGSALPKLVSITTNGAELKILEGMKGIIERDLPYISLASTGEGFHEYMESINYEYFVRDDRGYCFRRKKKR